MMNMNIREYFITFFTYMRNYMDYREESIFFGFIIGLIAIPQVIAYMILRDFWLCVKTSLYFAYY